MTFLGFETEPEVFVQSNLKSKKKKGLQILQLTALPTLGVKSPPKLTLKL